MSSKKKSGDSNAGDNGGFGIPLMDLRDLMELRGAEATEKVKQMGGPKQICQMLKTSETKGTDIMVIFIIIHNDRAGNRYLFVTFFRGRH